MSLFEDFIIVENNKASQKELEYTCSLINKTYNEWRKIRRRINAVDIISTTVNRIIKVNPDSLKYLDEEMKMKIAIVLMRCMDNPFWKPVHAKEKIYDKLVPLIKKLENFKLNTGTGGTLKEVIMTRMSANIAMQDKSNAGKVLVSYEPMIPASYVRYLMGESHKVDKIFKMQTLNMPGEFNTLVHVLTINLDKASKKHKKS